MPLAWRAPRAARWTFVAVVALGAIALAVAGRGQWFYGDDWAMITRRGDAGIGVWMKPYQQHWTTLPTIAYQVLWKVFGLHSYRPYQAMALGSHLAATTALWLVIRRSGVGPWTAVLAASTLLFTGVASDVAMWAVLVAFSAAVAFGYAHLLVADSDRLTPLRWGVAVACGIAALMSTSVGLFVLGASALALVLRRGWRTSAAVVAPPLAAYALWWTIWGRADRRTPSEAGDVIAFAWRVVVHAVEGSTAGTLGALVLVALLAAGTALAIATPRPSGAGRRRELAVPASCALAAIGFALANGWARAGRYGVEYADRGRFAYVVLALVLPAVAVALDAIAVRATVAAVAVWTLQVLAIVSGLHQIEPHRYRDFTPADVLAVADSPSLADASAAITPFDGAYGLGWVGVDWFRTARAAGHIPAASPSPASTANARARLALAVGPADPSLRCAPLTEAVAVELRREAPIGFRGPIEVMVVGPGGVRSRTRSFGSFEPQTLVTTDRSIDLVVRAAPVLYPAELCR